MLIPEKGKWRWNDGPLCDTREEALKIATKPIEVKDAQVFIVDHVEPLEVVDDA